MVDALNNLVTSHILAETGIINAIKLLDSKLSEAIMHAMKNGPELEQKVSRNQALPFSFNYVPRTHSLNGLIAV